MNNDRLELEKDAEPMPNVINTPTWILKRVLYPHRKIDSSN